MSRLFLVLVPCALLALIGGRAEAYRFRLSPAGIPLRWNMNAMPIPYRVSAELPAEIEALGEAIFRSLSGWELIPQSSVSFIYDGETDGGSALFDGVNLIAWITSEWPYGEDTLAMTTLWYSEADGTILEADVEFNAMTFDWSAEGAPDAMDLQNVATHEIGHLLGLDHSTEDAATMREGIRRGETSKRSLEEDEREAVAVLYPSPGASEVPRFLLCGQEGKGLSVLPVEWDLDEGERCIGMASIDGDGDGACGEVVALLETRDACLVSLYFLLEEEEGTTLIEDGSWTLPVGGVPIMVTSYDADGDGASDELGVLCQEHGRDLFFYGFAFPSEDVGEMVEISLDAWEIPSGNNAVALSALDGDGDGIRDEILVLKNRGAAGFFLKTYKAPLPYGLAGGEVQPGEEIGSSIWLLGRRTVFLDAAALTKGSPRAVAVVKESGEFPSLALYDVRADGESRGRIERRFDDVLDGSPAALVAVLDGGEDGPIRVLLLLPPSPKTD